MPHAHRTETPPDGAGAASAAPPFSSVLVPLDGSSFGESVLPHVRVIAKGADSEVHLLSVLDPERPGATGAGSAEMRLQVVEAETYLESVARRLRESGLDVGAEVRMGRPAEEIVRAVDELQADLVALAARPRRDDAHLVSRGVARAVMASGVASFLVARGNGGARLPALWREARYRNVLVPVDESPPSDRALGVAEEVASDEGGEVLSVHVEPGGQSGKTGRSRPGTRVPAAAAPGSWAVCLERPGGREDGRVVETRTVRCPGIAQAIADVVGRVEPDLVVLAAHGAGGSEAPYGHCARWLLQHADATILLLQDRPAQPHDVGTGRPGIRHGRRAGRSRTDPRVPLGRRSPGP